MGFWDDLSNRVDDYYAYKLTSGGLDDSGSVDPPSSWEYELDGDDSGDSWSDDDDDEGSSGDCEDEEGFDADDDDWFLSDRIDYGMEDDADEALSLHYARQNTPAPVETVAEQVGNALTQALFGFVRQEISFEDANILRFELVSRENSCIDEVEAYFNVRNTSQLDITRFDFEVAYRDAGGNTLCTDGRFCDYGVIPGHWTRVSTFSSIRDVFDLDEVADVVVMSYTYRMGNTEVDVDLEGMSAEMRVEHDEEELDFDSVDILKFGIKKAELNCINAYEVDLLARNVGSIPITRIDISVAFFDGNGNALCSDSRFAAVRVVPNTFVRMQTFSDREIGDRVRSCCVYAYEYELASEDERGNTSYGVDLRRRVARTS